jgi:hypothetical protein
VILSVTGRRRNSADPLAIAGKIAARFRNGGDQAHF